MKIASVTEAVPNGLLFLGPGRYMRDLEFPAIALRGNAIYVAWNDGACGPQPHPARHLHRRRAHLGGVVRHPRLRATRSSRRCRPMPAASTCSTTSAIPTTPSTCWSATPRTAPAFATKRVTTQSFPGTLTIPQFDPIIAFGYMGDYIANVSDGSHQYFAWGDNRDTVTDFLYPNGRNDPDVFFAKQ